MKHERYKGRIVLKSWQQNHYYPCYLLIFYRGKFLKYDLQKIADENKEHIFDVYAKYGVKFLNYEDVYARYAGDKLSIEELEYYMDNGICVLTTSHNTKEYDYDKSQIIALSDFLDELNSMRLFISELADKYAQKEQPDIEKQVELREYYLTLFWGVSKDILENNYEAFVPLLITKAYSRKIYTYLTSHRLPHSNMATEAVLRSNENFANILNSKD